MLGPIVVTLLSLALLLWGAGRFIEGAAATARHLGLPPLLIGMVVVGFGTSAPEMLVSALAALQGSAGLALGNAYGSNIANIALILGVTAIVRPITVHSSVLRKELPILAAVTALAAWQLRDGWVSRVEAVALLLVFAALMGWTTWQGVRNRVDPLGTEMADELQGATIPARRAVVRLLTGLVLLLVSARALVWGAVAVASRLGVADLIIGLTVVAVGTSLPELASSVIAARKGEHDLALGNVLGSNLFNTLAVVGIAASVQPAAAGREVLTRDIAVMGGLTLSLFVFGVGLRAVGRINRLEGAVLLACYIAYGAWLVAGVSGT